MFGLIVLCALTKIMLLLTLKRLFQLIIVVPSNLEGKRKDHGMLGDRYDSSPSCAERIIRLLGCRSTFVVDEENMQGALARIDFVFFQKCFHTATDLEE